MRLWHKDQEKDHQVFISPLLFPLTPLLLTSSTGSSLSSKRSWGPMFRATHTEAKDGHEHPQQARAEHDRHSSLVEMLLFLLQHRPALLWVAECRAPVAFRWFYRKQEVIFIIRVFYSVFSETETFTPPQNTVFPWCFLEEYLFKMAIVTSKL